ncbi:MAG: methyltransferase domain-containing protein [Clostridiales bacterium]
MSEVINSKEYWEKRFAEKNWEINQGREQSKYFAELFKVNAPQWLINHINTNGLSVIDMGCAEGDGTQVLSEVFSGKIYGMDFSKSAIEQAKNRYPEIDFFCGDIRELPQKWDVLFLSNVIEHFKDPIATLKQISQFANHHIIVMVPFEEEPIEEEHEMVFTYENIPVAIGEFNLIYFNNTVDFPEGKVMYHGKQILLIYSQDQEVAQKLFIDDTNAFISQDSSLELEACKNRYLQAKIALDNELLVSQKAYVRIQSLEDKLKGLEGEVFIKNETLSNLMSDIENKDKQLVQRQENIQQISSELFELQKAIVEREDETDRAIAEREEWQEKYDNLYVYSCRRDGQLQDILDSRSYKVFSKYFKPPMQVSYKVLKKIKRICKAISALNFKEAAREIFSPFNKVVNRAKAKINSKQLLRQIANDVRGMRIIILPPTLDWSMPLFQRPHQLAFAYSRKPNTVVFYMTKNIQYDQIGFAQKVDSNLWVVNELYLNKLCTVLHTASQKILSLSWTPNKFYCDIVKPDKLIYEYIDELEIFHMYGTEMEKDHQELMAKADVTVCTATKLYDQAKDKARNAIVSTNAGDYEFFAKTPQYEINPLIRECIKPFRCVLGYYGAVAKWFDYDLVKKVAKMYPEWLWVILGIDYDKTLGKSGFEKFENIIYIPPQPYKELPSFLTGFDIATIPFLINEITLSTSPVKLFEYMAGGKPIIASRMPECLKYESVMTYSNAEEFCEHVEWALRIKEGDPYWDKLKIEALANTWDAKTDEILEAFK